MNLSTIRSQVSALKTQMPPPKGRPMTVVFLHKGPRPADAPADTETRASWYYESAAELEELRAKYEREFGPDTRGPNDMPCLLVQFMDQAQIFEEKYKGTRYESLWMGGPTAEAVTP